LILVRSIYSFGASHRIYVRRIVSCPVGAGLKPARTSLLSSHASENHHCNHRAHPKIITAIIAHIRKSSHASENHHCYHHAHPKIITHPRNPFRISDSI
jgi:hypothetical protein